MSACFKCGEALSFRTTVGFKECCSRCDSDVHCCKNCRFYDPASYNSCREPQAERVVEKDRANFCDYFKLAENTAASGKESTPAGNAKSALDQLFKK